MKIGLFYRISNPSPWQIDWHQLYSDTLEQVAYADELGFASVATTEHHFVPDGYIPCPLTVEAAMAARTKRLQICSWILLLPLYHPLRLAEQAAIVDIISGGRLVLGMGLGYRWEEFEAFGVPREKSGKVADEALEVLIRAFTEDSVTFEGQFFRIQDVTLAPKSYRKPRPVIWMGHPTNPAAIRRVAKWGLDGFAGLPSPEMYNLYLEYCREYGTEPKAETQGWLVGHCDPDSDRAWQDGKPHAQWAWSTLRDMWWNHGDTRRLGSPLRDDSYFMFGNPEQWIERLEAMNNSGVRPLDQVHVCLQLPGMPRKQVMRSMELFARDVLPHFHKDLPSATGVTGKG